MGRGSIGSRRSSTIPPPAAANAWRFCAPGCPPVTTVGRSWQALVTAANAWNADPLMTLPGVRLFPSASEPLSPCDRLARQRETQERRTDRQQEAQADVHAGAATLPVLEQGHRLVAEGRKRGIPAADPQGQEGAELGSERWRLHPVPPDGA